MQRHDMIDAMRGLGLKGIAGAFDRNGRSHLTRHHDQTLCAVERFGGALLILSSTASRPAWGTTFNEAAQTHDQIQSRESHYALGTPFKNSDTRYPSPWQHGDIV